MKRELSVLLLIASAFALAVPSEASPVKATTIDSHGRQIASVFSGISPNPRIAHAIARMMQERREGLAVPVQVSCPPTLKKASYHPQLKGSTSIKEGVRQPVRWSLHG